MRELIRLAVVYSWIWWLPWVIILTICRAVMVQAQLSLLRYGAAFVWTILWLFLGFVVVAAVLPHVYGHNEIARLIKQGY